MNRLDVKIVTTRKKFLKWSCRPTLLREKQLPNRVIAIEKGK